jgi:peptidoglycan hydrolase-like protein with peptidoglycan-binding domain
VSREGVDYAWHGPIDTRAFRAAGVTFAMRYLSHDDGKNLHRGEADRLSGAGIDVGVVWETTPRRPLSGFDAGVEDARNASTQAARCGMPPGRPIFFAVDYDAPDGDKPTIANYLTGAASVLGGAGSVGVYGGYWVVKYCLDRQVARYAWQTRAWSGGQRDPRAHLYQHTIDVRIGGVACDLNTGYPADFGQWRSRAAPAAPPFPYPAADYLATPREDVHCHSGADPRERAIVTRWQLKMANRAWRIAVDGSFGAESDRVCRRFQEEKGLLVDGKVGPITWSSTWTAPVT